MYVRVKICGVTSIEDALIASELGADAVGFNFWRGSPRYCDPELAAEISSNLPALVDKVGIFVNAPMREVDRIATRVRLSAVQLHGEETPGECSGRPLPVIKGVQITKD